MRYRTPKLPYHLLSAICLLACLFFCTAPARAASSEARQLLGKTINQVLDELQNPKLKNPSTSNVVLTRVEAIIRRLFSFQELSMRTVGPAWKSFTPDQQQRFSTSFESLLRTTYLKKLDGYNGETVSYTSETHNTKGDKVEIGTTVNIKGKPVSVAYRMLKKNSWVVYDVIIEGVGMVQNYRSQFQQILTKEDAEQLIKLVRTKAQEAYDPIEK